MQVNARGRYFDGIANKLDTEIRDLLKNEDITDGDGYVDELFVGIASAANDAMIDTFVADMQSRHTVAA